MSQVASQIVSHFASQPAVRFMLLWWVAGTALLFAGCGTGEDFSKPPTNLAAIRSRAKEKAPKTASTMVASVSISQPQTSAASSDPPAGTAAPTAPPPSVTGRASATGAAGLTTPIADQSPDTRASAPAEVAESEAHIGTADTMRREENSAPADNGATGSAGTSLLDNLRGDNNTGHHQSAVKQNRGNEKQAGRFAIAPAAWANLQNHLAKRFYIAATDGGRRFAASAGRGSVRVVSSPLTDGTTPLSLDPRTRTDGLEPSPVTVATTETISGLTAIELLDNGDVVVMGTEDGRLLSRSSARRQHLDIYAQDLLVFQDEHRPATKIADSAVTVIRRIGTERLLIATEKSGVHLWSRADVVPPPVDPLQLTPDDVRSPESAEWNIKPLHPVHVPDAAVLSLTLSIGQRSAAIVTADEQVTVFSTKDGETIARLSAADLDDTQPVAALPEGKSGCLLVALADGRILRRALPDGDPIARVNDRGATVDFETVYAPDPRDKPGPITTLAIDPNGRTLYIGQLDGTLVQFDLQRRERLNSQRLHRSPVIEILSTDSGVYSVAADREVVRSDASASHLVNHRFKLAADPELRRKTIVQSKDPARRRAPERRNVARPVTPERRKRIEQTIRPDDPVLMLREHQLRVARTEQQRTTIRSQIQELNEITPSTESPNDDESRTSPRLMAELPADFDFSTRPLRRVVMSLNNSGSTLAVAQYCRRSSHRELVAPQPVVVWDTFSQTQLRHWTQCRNVCGLRLAVDSGLVLPTPMQARMQLYDGQVVVQPVRYLTSDVSNSGGRLAVGLSTGKQTALPVVQLLDDSGNARLSGVETFEGAATALAWSHDDAVLYVNVRERDRVRLVQLSGTTLAIAEELSVEPITGPYDPDHPDPDVQTLGATVLLPSPGGRYLVTYGRYSDRRAPYQLRIWARKGDRWSRDDAQILSSKEPIVSHQMTESPFQFVGQQDNLLAVTGHQGIGVVDLRSGRVKETLPLPDNSDRRPMTLFAPDGAWVLAGDQEGKIWTWNLRALNKKPRSFKAQAGPITGLAVSANGQCLATVGEENRVRIWDVRHYLKASDATTHSAPQPALR